jgi:hypothetical protein
MGNAQTDTTYLIKNLTPGKYDWKVQAVDQGYRGGYWADGGMLNAKNVQAFFNAGTVCQGSPTNFTNQSTAYKETIQSYAWDFGDGTTSVEKEPNHTFSTSGIHNVKLIVTSVTDIDTLIKPVMVNPTPAPDFSTEGICEDAEITIVNLTVTQGINITDWGWEFGDGLTDTVRNPGSHVYINSGEYPVSLTSITDHGCSRSTVKAINVADALPKPQMFSKGPVVWYLACSNDSANYYHWYCNRELIQGASSFLYIANRKVGRYYVSISDNGQCFTASDTVGIPTGYTGIEDIDPFAGLSLYPNPTSGLITVDLENQLFGDMNVTIVTINGKEIYSNKFEKTTEHFSGEVDLSDKAEGIYFITFTLENYSAVRKIVLE